MGDRAVFLTEQDQKDMGLTFVDRLPWNSFGRKNVGYLYAISQGILKRILKFLVEGIICETFYITLFAE